MGSSRTETDCLNRPILGCMAGLFHPCTHRSLAVGLMWGEVDLSAEDIPEGVDS